MTGTAIIPSARLILPPQLSGGNLHQLFTHMGLRAELGSGTDEWIISDNTVRNRQSTQNLVRADLLAGPQLKKYRFDVLATSGQDEYMRNLSDGKISEEVARIARYGSTKDLTSTLYLSQVEVMSASDAQLESVVRRWHENFANQVFSDQPSEHVFPNSSTHWISMSPVLYWRSFLPAMLMRLEHDPTFAAHLRAGTVKPTGNLMFASNNDLTGPAMLHGNYLGPLLACFSPQVWSVHCSRILNSIIFNFGRTVPGQAPIPMDALDLLPHRYGTRSTTPDSEPDPGTRMGWRESIDWWAMRLDQLFSFLSDPATFQDNTGIYQPYRHQNWMINTAEIFDRVTSALRSTRDAYSALILTFSALDLVSEKFLGSDTGSVANPTTARKALEEIRDSMPDQVAAVLIPGAERAVKALDSVADGFFLNTEMVEYNSKKGTVRKTPMEAVGPLLRARRNAVHGFGGNESESRGAHELLAQHRGDLPQDLAHLPYLYLLKVLCNPDALRQRIERGLG